MDSRDEAIVAGLRGYFMAREDITFALLFGSWATGRRHAESDLDLAIYVRSPGQGIDLEECDRFFPGEDGIWTDVERISGTVTDLVVLNRAPATVAAAALGKAVLMACADPGIFRRYVNAVTTLAEDERAFAREFLLIKARSRSLSEIDRDRLVRIVDFMETELEDDAGGACAASAPDIP